MAQLLLISKATERPGTNQIGDIVGVYEDEHIFSPAELSAFDIKKVDEKVNVVYSELEKKYPDTKSFTEDEIKERVTIPKYPYVMIDNTKTTIATACACKVTIKPQVILEDIIDG